MIDRLHGDSHMDGYDRKTTRRWQIKTDAMPVDADRGIPVMLRMQLFTDT